jgi:phosphatidate cytidylyltransferase
MLPLLLIVYFGGNVLAIACFLIGIFGAREFLKGFENLEIHGEFAFVVGAAALLYAFGIGASQGGYDPSPYYVLWFFLVTFVSMLFLFSPKHDKLEDAMVMMVSLFYIVFFSYHVYLVDGLTEYKILIWLIFITAFGTDIFAYFTGYLIGKHKLCPNISPKKTVEGAIGGALGSLGLCAAFAAALAPDLMKDCLIIGIAGGVISQFGDLTASIFKRKMGIKDYGNLIPGHGGIMDRFDSILFTAPMVYYYITLVMMR